MSPPYETDQRLRGFLNTNQEKQEQMCLALLATDRRFSELKPRHPRGGPDGRRDIQGLYKANMLIFGAVAFLVNANDSDEQKRRLEKKFHDDLARALEAKIRPRVLLLLTNIALTVSEIRRLEEAGIAAGLAFCEVFDRERVMQSSLPPVLVGLVYLRVSQINNCAFCLDMHTRDLLKEGEKIEKIALVQAWAEAGNLFDERERAALAWAETVTRVADTGVPDKDYQAARAVFDERELVDLTIAISLMNAYNRMAISFRNTPQASLEA